ncbi:MAG TPA: TIR domain-containing protein [Steroidobacteraceae bacterium]
MTATRAGSAYKQTYATRLYSKRGRAMPEQFKSKGAVFISYGSQDAEAAGRICEALQAAGIEVWFDQAELRGGDAWDSQIKTQIANCALFLPVISANTNARIEGYFRREWNLATRRLLDMAHDAAFLVPVVIDDTRELQARVPEEFLRAQWTRLPGGETPPAFAHRVRQLLGGDHAPVRAQTTTTGEMESGVRRAVSMRPSRARRVGLAVVALLLILAAAAFWHYHSADESPVATFAPPSHSVAVLAFANMSGDRNDEYFSDGLSEEILQSLAQVADLQVAARTSSFSFKGTAVDIPTVGRKLNVGAVLEGSVRRSGARVRVTAQLINAVSGFHIWSQNFDREFKDVIALQSEIAVAVASALEVRLLPGKLQTPGGTLNPKALDAYLRGRAGERIQDEKNLRLALAALDEAVALDPQFANAHALRGDVMGQLANAYVKDPAEKRRLQVDALQEVKRAVAIAPDSSSAYGWLGRVLANTTSDYAAADAAYRRSMELAPGSASALVGYASFAILMGRADALPAVERARELDPLNPSVLSTLGMVQFYSRRYDEARKSMLESMGSWNNRVTQDWLALNELASGNPAAALPYCEQQSASWSTQLCLAIAYDKLGRRREAEAALRKLKDEEGDAAACQYAVIHAQWGQPSEAIKWLERAVELKDPGLIEIKADPLLDPLRKIDRFQELVAAQPFPTASTE